MAIIRKEEGLLHYNAPTCAVTEYQFGDRDLDGALARISGRYPEQGRVTNLACKEVAFVVSGQGRVVIDGQEAPIKAGDTILIGAGQKYFWEGELSLFLACTPAWTPEQHKQVE